MLRGASKDILNEVERNLQDAIHVARNIFLNPKLVPGGGAVEMEVSHLLTEKSKNLKGVIQWPYRYVKIMEYFFFTGKTTVPGMSIF